MFRTFKLLLTLISNQANMPLYSIDSCMKAIGSYLVDVIKRNPKTFRIFSPDELA